MGSCSACAAGMYCPGGSVQGTPCPTGTFRSIVQGQVLGDCAICGGGYCPILGTVTPTACPIYTDAYPVRINTWDAALA